MQNYNKHIGYVDIWARMVNSTSIQHQTEKWKKIFFHIFLPLSTFWIKMTHTDFFLLCGT